MPPDVQILTRSDLDALQTRYWVEDTAIGSIFGVGALVGFVVGTMILFQVLSTDIRSHLPQYATMKAMGFANHRIYLLVVQQSWLFAALGYAPAFVAALGVYRLAYDETRIPIFMTTERALSVLALCLIMCTTSAILSLRRIRNADPAELF